MVELGWISSADGPTVSACNGAWFCHCLLAAVLPQYHWRDSARRLSYLDEEKMRVPRSEEERIMGVDARR